MIIIKSENDGQPAPLPFRWWKLLYYTLQNAVIIGALDWLVSLLFQSRWPVFSTYFLVTLFIILTLIGYSAATNPRLRRRPVRSDYELSLEPAGITVRHPGTTDRLIAWGDIARLEWQESNHPPAAVFYFKPKTTTYRTFGGDNSPGPALFRIELVGFNQKPLEIYRLLDYYWNNPTRRAELKG